MSRCVSVAAAAAGLPSTSGITSQVVEPTSNSRAAPCGAKRPRKAGQGVPVRRRGKVRQRRRDLRRHHPSIDQVDARVPVVRAGADRLQDELHAGGLRLEAVGQFAGHRHRQVVARRGFGDGRADLLGELVAGLRHRAKTYDWA